MPDATRQPALTAATRRRVKQRAQHPKRSCGARPLNTVRCNSAQHVETPERTKDRSLSRFIESGQQDSLPVRIALLRDQDAAPIRTLDWVTGDCYLCFWRWLI